MSLHLRNTTPQRKLFTLRRLAALGLLAVLCTVWAVPRATLGAISRALVVREEPVESDAIVVLLGGDTPDRVLTAYGIYKRGFAHRIVFGTGYVDKQIMASMPRDLLWPPSSDRYRTALLSLGVPAEHLEVVNTDDAFDTSGELTDIARRAGEAGWRRVILVSTASHSRRVKLIWERVAPGIEDIVVGAPNEELERWWRSPLEMRSVAYEIGALVKELGRRIVGARAAAVR